MTNIHRYLFMLTICGVAAAFVGAKARALANPPAKESSVVRFSEMLAKPADYTDRDVVFACRFASTGKLFRQNDRNINNRSYANFGVWADDAALWEKNARRDILPSLYVSRDNPVLLKQLGALRRYDLVSITGTVFDNYAGMPWVEVTSMRILPEKNAAITDTLLAEITKGLELLEAGKQDDGVRILTSAVSTGAPDYVAKFVADRVARAKPKLAESATALDPMALITAARTAAAKGDIPAAIAQYRKAGAGDSPLLKSVWFYRELGQLYMISDEPDHYLKARNLFAHVNTISGGNDVPALLNLGQIALELKEYKSAEESFNQCLKLDPNNAQAMKLLTQVVSAQLAERTPATSGMASSSPAVKNVASAAATQMSAENAFDLGQRLMQQGRFAEAESSFRLAMKGADLSVAHQAKTLLASALLAQNKTAEAMKLLEATAAPAQTSAPVAAVKTPVVVDVTRNDLDQATREMERISKELDAATSRNQPIANAIATPAPQKLTTPAAPAELVQKPQMTAANPVNAVSVPQPVSQPRLTEPTVKKVETPVKPISRTTDDSPLPDWAL